MLSILALFVALMISSVSAYFSIVGLTAIFAAAKISIIIMGGVLEFGKVVTAVFVHKHWKTLNWKLKTYLGIAIVVLMMITSMGIFGFLSKANLDQALPSDQTQIQLNIINQKIQTDKDNITAANQELAQLDQAVNQLMSRTTDAIGAQRAINVRKSQTKERASITDTITKSNQDMLTLQQQAAPLLEQQNKLAVEVGPVKYIAQLIYGQNANQNQLEAAVRIVIMMLVAVFDPLAIVLMLAASSTINPKKPEPVITEPVQEKIEPEEEPMNTEPDMSKIMLDNTLVSLRNKMDEVEEHKKTIDDFAAKEAGYMQRIELLQKSNEDLTAEYTELQSKHDLLMANYDNATQTILDREKQIQDMYELHTTHMEKLMSSVDDLSIRLMQEQNSKRDYERATQHLKDQIEELNQPKLMAERTINSASPELQPEPEVIIEKNFGTRFPDTPVDWFVRTDSIPHELFKSSGLDWIALDKTEHKDYIKDKAYVQYLIDKIATNGIHYDKLLPHEQEAIMDALTNN